MSGDDIDETRATFGGGLMAALVVLGDRLPPHRAWDWTDVDPAIDFLAELRLVERGPDGQACATEALYELLSPTLEAEGFPARSTERVAIISYALVVSAATAHAAVREQLRGDAARAEAILQGPGWLPTIVEDAIARSDQVGHEIN